MIKPNDTFVSVYDGFAISMRVVGVRGSRLILLDAYGDEVKKHIKQKENGKPYFYHNQHCYRLEAAGFNTTEFNRLKL